MRRSLRSFVIAAALAASTPLAAAEYPDRPIHIIVPLQAGSLSDNLARILGAKLGERLGQQVVVENRVGGSTVVGSEAVARAAPDGYTMEIVNTSSHATVAATGAKLPFDPVADFAPVGMIGTSPFVLVASNRVPAHSVAELIALARQQPGRLSYASAGVGTIAHLAAELLQRLAHIELTHVPYRGTSQAVFDLMEGRIDLEVGTLSGTESHIKAGKLRARWHHEPRMASRSFPIYRPSRKRACREPKSSCGPQSWCRQASGRRSWRG